jgi:hypothetical protein
MAQIPRTIACPYPGFETFHVTYNMMAEVADVEALADSMGAGPEHDRSAAILDHTGWPEDAHPGGPFGRHAPMLVLIWTLREGFANAVAAQVNDPLSRTRL